jgi:hypothetical protein
MTDVLLDVAIRDLKDALTWTWRGESGRIVDEIIDRVNLILSDQNPDLSLPMTDQERIAEQVEDTIQSQLDPGLINAAVDVLMALGEDVRHLKAEE